MPFAAGLLIGVLLGMGGMALAWLYVERQARQDNEWWQETELKRNERWPVKPRQQ